MALFRRSLRPSSSVNALIASIRAEATSRSEVACELSDAEAASRRKKAVTEVAAEIRVFQGKLKVALGIAAPLSRELTAAAPKIAALRVTIAQTDADLAQAAMELTQAEHHDARARELVNEQRRLSFAVPQMTAEAQRLRMQANQFLQAANMRTQTNPTVVGSGGPLMPVDVACGVFSQADAMVKRAERLEREAAQAQDAIARTSQALADAQAQAAALPQARARKLSMDEARSRLAAQLAPVAAKEAELNQAKAEAKRLADEIADRNANMEDHIARRIMLSDAALAERVRRGRAGLNLPDGRALVARAARATRAPLPVKPLLGADPLPRSIMAALNQTAEIIDDEVAQAWARALRAGYDVDRLLDSLIGCWAVGDAPSGAFLLVAERHVLARLTPRRRFGETGQMDWRAERVFAGLDRRGDCRLFFAAADGGRSAAFSVTASTFLAEHRRLDLT